MELKEKYVKEVCRLSQGEKTCRYLRSSPGGWHCIKGSPSEKAETEKHRALGAMNAMGDNCSGPPKLKAI